MKNESFETPAILEAMKRKTQMYLKLWSLPMVWKENQKSDPHKDFEKKNTNATENSEKFGPHKSYEKRH